MHQWSKQQSEVEMANGYHLHIICLDVPYPVDYGGVFDLFYKIKALSEAGVNIHLHCFEYGRGKQPMLNEYCVEVNYYDRLTGFRGFSPGIPYIVSSRANASLLHRLLQDDYPILMEGMHSTYFLHSGQLIASRCFVRMHNVEFQYYRQLAATTSSLHKKLYFKRESHLLNRYETSLADKGNFWTVTTKDLEVFVNMGYQKIDYLPLFLPEYETAWSSERGTYCLYHGNLSVPENDAAACWLLKNIFSQVKIPFVIAGKQPSEKLVQETHKNDHCCIVADPGEKEMLELIRKAQVNILPSLNETGIKLKLINALYNGKHCLVNTAGVAGSGLNDCCEIADTPLEMQAKLQLLFDKDFSKEQYEERLKVLHNSFDNDASAKQLIQWIFLQEPVYPGSAKRLKTYSY